MTSLATSGTLLAIGYSRGTVLVFNLNEMEKNETVMQVSPFPKEHSFSLHNVNSPVTCLTFFDNSTQLVSGGADTHIILYDLISGSAEFKLMGHNESIV